MVGPLMPHRIVMLGVGYQALLERETRTPLHRTVSHPAPQASGRGEKGKGVTPAGRVPQRCCSALLSLPALKRQAALVQPAVMLPSTLQSRETLREATSRAAGSGGRRRAVSRSVARAPAESQGPSVGAVTGLLRPGPVVWQTPGPPAPARWEWEEAPASPAAEEMEVTRTHMCDSCRWVYMTFHGWSECACG